MKLNDTDENFVFILVLRPLFPSCTTEELAQLQLANYPFIYHTIFYLANYPLYSKLAPIFQNILYLTNYPLYSKLAPIFQSILYLANSSSITMQTSTQHN
jgi:prepilin signal peptidase PulO-like enzyme (type II secretory pathway)